MLVMVVISSKNYTSSEFLVRSRRLLYHCTAVNLFKRQPGLARRSALLQQVWASVKSTPIVVW